LNNQATKAQRKPDQLRSFVAWLFNPLFPPKSAAGIKQNFPAKNSDEQHAHKTVEEAHG
jgi:hypothetical protein